MLQSIEVGRGTFVMASAISSYEYDASCDITTITLKGRKKDPYRINGDYVSKINGFLARGAITLYLNGTCQDRK